MDCRKAKIGIIGGSGFSQPQVMVVTQKKIVETPFGPPSDSLIIGLISGVDCVVIHRHGSHHTIMPGKVNYRANIWALKSEGCTHILAVTACGSLQEHLHPGDIVFIDQFIDRTTSRVSTFYDGSVEQCKGISHLPMNKPFCTLTSEILANCCKELRLKYHSKGTNVTIEGPRFSTKAESHLYRSWGCDVINMTTVPEVILAKELGLCYVAIALVTDYDCWKENHASVSKDSVFEVLKQNGNKVIDLLKYALPKIAASDFLPVLLENEEIAKSSVL